MFAVLQDFCKSNLLKPKNTSLREWYSDKGKLKIPQFWERANSKHKQSQNTSMRTEWAL